MTSDLELIKSIKENNDSAALTELVNRHTGLYSSIINQFAGYSSNINKNDMLDERLFNIWEYAKDYDENRNMKFSTFLGQRIKFACQTILSKNKIEMVDIANTIPDCNNFMNQEEAKDDIQEILNHTEEDKDKLFREILRLRSADKKATWAEIGKEVGVSYEWARKVYYKRLKQLKKKILK